MTNYFPFHALLAVLFVALVGRVLLLASGALSFHADEAVISLMARHILQGERPIFFYGQAYMGSLDAWLIAIGFWLLGESVMTVRVVQAVLYLLVVASGFYAAWRLSGRAVVAAVMGLTLAIPPVLLAVYTSVTLGGYNETLIFGNLLVALGYEVSRVPPAPQPPPPQGGRGSVADAMNRAPTGDLLRWTALGLVAGLAWWTNGLIVAYALPVGALVLYRLVRPNALTPLPPLHQGEGGQDAGAMNRVPTGRLWVGLAVCAVCFFVGSAPWWMFNFEHEWAALAFYTGGGSPEFAGNDVPALTFDQRIAGLLVLGLPTLVGLRFPWSPAFFAPLVGALVLLLYIAALVRLARGRGLRDGDARVLVLGMVVSFCVLFFVSRFSVDPTGRYFLPLSLPFGVALGAMVDGLMRRVTVKRAAGDASIAPTQALGADAMYRVPTGRRWAAVGVVALVVAYYAAGQFAAAQGYPGLTPLFNLDQHIPNDHDAELIAFLDERGLHRGYATFWVAMRLAFLSGERMQYSSALPTMPTFNAIERYPAYRAAADAEPNPAYITAKVPEVQAQLEAIFERAGVTYLRESIGEFTVYYDFAPSAPEIENVRRQMSDLG